MIARLMQEEEDLLRSQELQNDYYSENRPPTATATRGGNVRVYDDAGASGYRAPDADRMERLIPDSRQELFGDEWEMREHIGGGVQNHHNAQTEDEMSLAILESMKNARTGDMTTEDELIARALRESMLAAK